MLFAKLLPMWARKFYTFTALAVSAEVLSLCVAWQNGLVHAESSDFKHLGLQYSNGINTSAWHYSGSEFECRLEHSVPFFGDAVFRKRAGESSAFYMQSLDARFAAGEVQLTAQAPAWGDGHKVSMAKVKLKRGKRPLWLGNKETEQMLAHLNGGREISIARKAWFAVNHSEAAKLSISNIGFRAEYRKYLSCLGSLLPANFDQLQRSALYFQPGVSDPLTQQTMNTLDNIIMLIAKDKSIQKFFIDGHASSVGERADNLVLSKKRADLVANYLKRHGVPEDQIVTRWHGERYPVMPNNTVKGRAKNRRVTVRLEKVEESKAPQPPAES